MLHASFDNPPPTARPTGHSRRPISEAIARSIIENTDIVAIVGEVVDLRKKGDEFVGLCPFHNDTNPSMSVNGEKGIYSCWSCEAGGAGSRAGDAVTFVRRYFNMGYREALEYLAPRAGVSLDGSTPVVFRPSPRQSPVVQSAPDPDRPDSAAAPAPLLRALADAEGFFADALSSSEQAQEYLAARGFDLKAISNFALGFASASPFELQNKLMKLYGEKVLLDAGLVRARISQKTGKRYTQDFFLNRLTFAIRNESGVTVAFGARKLGSVDKTAKAPKYINSPDTAVFAKSDELFGLFEAKKEIERKGWALVVEGYFDVLALTSHGVGNVVAPMGTSLTEGQIRKLLAYAKRVVLCLDGDTAGQQAMLRALKTVLPQVDSPDRLAFLTLPDGLDPDEMFRVKKETGSQFLVRVSHAKSLAGFIGSTLEGLIKDPAIGVKGATEYLDILLKASEHLTQFHELLAHYGARLLASQAQGALRQPATAAINTPLGRLTLAASHHKEGGQAALTALTAWAHDAHLESHPGVRDLLANLRIAVGNALPIDPTTQSPAARFASAREAELLAQAVKLAADAFSNGHPQNNGAFPRRPDFLRGTDRP